MPTNAPLQRSNRKRAGLAALVALACSTPVAAQAPSIVETVAYINSHCVDYAWDSAISKETTLIMHADDGSITLASRTDYFGNDESVYVITDSFDLRRVEIVKSRRYADDLDDFINFRCGANAHCVSRNLLDQSIGTSTDSQRPVANIHCREPDRVLKAFRHLRRLLGGPAADPFGD